MTNNNQSNHKNNAQLYTCTNIQTNQKQLNMAGNSDIKSSQKSRYKSNPKSNSLLQQKSRQKSDISNIAISNGGYSMIHRDDAVQNNFSKDKRGNNVDVDMNTMMKKLNQK